MRSFKLIVLFVAISGMVLGVISCQGLQTLTGPKATLEISPAKIFLSPALIKKPVTFKGKGFNPEEMITIEMVLPPKVKMKGVEEGADVGVALATADKKGNFSVAMKPMATLNWFFQVGWTPLLKPNFKEARPIPPGDYKINATGLDSDRIATSILTIVPPPKKK